MPAKSEKEAHLMQMALAVKSGKKKLSDMPKGVQDKIKKITNDMTEKQIREFTKVQEAKKPKFKVGDHIDIEDIVMNWNDEENSDLPLTGWTISGIFYDEGNSGPGYVEATNPHASEKMSVDFSNIHVINEDGSESVGPSGAATLDNTVGRSSYDFGNNPENGNSDQRHGSGEVFGGVGQRELTPEEKEMLCMTQELADGGTKIMEFNDFKAKLIKESFVAPKKVDKAISTHLGDFGDEARNIISKLPKINGLLDIDSVNKALNKAYPKNKVQIMLESIKKD